MNKLHSPLKRFEKSKRKLWNSLSAEINPLDHSDRNTLFEHVIIAWVSFLLASQAFNTDEWCHSEYSLFFLKCQHKIRGLHTLLFLLAATHSGRYFTYYILSQRGMCHPPMNLFWLVSPKALSQLQPPWTSFPSTSTPHGVFFNFST